MVPTLVHEEMDTTDRYWNTATSKTSADMTREELLAKSSHWTLGCDNALLNRLKEFSENLVKSAQEITDSCDSLQNDVDVLQFRVSNVTNQFIMLSNTQFVENCVQEFEEYDLEGPSNKKKGTPVETKAEKEAALIAKMKESIRIGTRTQKEREISSAAAIEESLSESTELRFTSSVNLAHLIGSSKFFSSRYCGLLNESRLTSINSRASSSTSSSSNVDGVMTKENISPPETLSKGLQETVPQHKDGSKYGISPIPPPLPTLLQSTGTTAYPKVLPTKAVGEQEQPYGSSDVGEPPGRPPAVFFPVPPRPPSSSNSSAASSFEETTIAKGSNSFDAPTHGSYRARSVTPPDIRPPPVLDLSDSDDDFFQPVAVKPSFDTYFGSQSQQQVLPPPVTSSPPEPSHTLKQDNIFDDIPKPQISILKPEVDATPESRTSSTFQSTQVTSKSSQPAKPEPEEPAPPALSGRNSVSNSKSNVSSIKQKIAADIKSVIQNRGIAPRVVPDASPKIAYSEPEKPKIPEPPKRVSIFDSSDSDDDLFSSLSTKGPKKSSLFDTTPPRGTTSGSTKTSFAEKLPPPVLDMSDSDEDIFKSVNLDVNARKNANLSFLLNLPPQPSREQEVLDNDNSIFSSPASNHGTETMKVNTPPPVTVHPGAIFSDSNPGSISVTIPNSRSFPEKSPNTASPPATKEADREVPNLEPDLKTITAVSKTMVPKSFVASDESSTSPLPDLSSEKGVRKLVESTNAPDPLLESKNETTNENASPTGSIKGNAAKATSITQNQEASPRIIAQQPDIVRTPVVVPDLQPQSTFRSHISEPPPITEEDDDDDDDIFASISSRPAAQLHQTPPRQPPPFPGPAPKFKPQHLEKVKSIFDSSDSDDDLFAPKFKTKSTPTLREISPQPNPPFSVPPAMSFPVLDRSEIRPPPVLDMSDSSEDDLFPSTAKFQPKATEQSQLFTHSALPENIPSTPVQTSGPNSTSLEVASGISEPTKQRSMSTNKDILTKVPAPAPLSARSKFSKEKSLFDSTDSDDDLFSTAKSKRKSSTNTARSVKPAVSVNPNLPVIEKPKAAALKLPVKSKVHSLFGDSEDEDDLFGKGRSEPIIAGKSELPAAQSNQEVDKGVMPEQVVNDTPSSTKIMYGTGPKSGISGERDKLFGDVTKSLESIFSGKTLSVAKTPTGSSREMRSESVSFDDDMSTDNLLHCVTRDRPRIQYARRPPSLRKRMSKSSSSLLMPNSEELDPFV